MNELGGQFTLPGITSTSSLPIRQGNETMAPTRRKKRGQRPEQLRMFMSPADLMKLPQGDQVHYGPGITDQEQRDYWSHKRGDSVLTDAGPYGNGRENLSSSIRRSGVERPVDLVHGHQQFAPWYGKDPTMLANGAHRVATAVDVRPNQLVPVMHHSTDDEEDEKQRPAWATKVPKAMGWRDDR